MKFPWHKYYEKELNRRKTLQVFITNACDLKCNGCFAKSAIKNDNSHISIEEYKIALKNFLNKKGKQINLFGGEPLLHPNLEEILNINRSKEIKTTIYTNGNILKKYKKDFFKDIKLRVSIYSLKGKIKGTYNIPKTDIPFDANFMISKKTTLKELCESANYIEKNYNSKTFFVFSMLELNNPKQEFFYETDEAIGVLEYKKMVHEFLDKYTGKMEIHVSKRGVFESTTTLPDTKCNFSNYFIGGKIIQCPYDVANLKFQKNYKFGKRSCQHNNTCLMSKVIYVPKK